MTKTRAEYEEWKKKHGVELKACSGFSSRIYVSEEVVVKEQILSLHHGEWVSLQLYRDDVPGMAETREKILREDEEIEISKKGMESIIFFRTHKWMEEEVEPMQRAADAKLTPPLMDHFYVTLAHPKFRLGITLQNRLHFVCSEWKDREGGVCEGMAKFGAGKFLQIVEKVAEEGLVYLDWNPANLGLTSTDKLQLLDWACTIKEHGVRLRKNLQRIEEKETVFALLWRKAVMLKSLCKTWALYQDDNAFFKCIYLPFCRAANNAEKLCREHLEIIAEAGTDYSKVLDVCMFDEIEEE